jgi:hypothetical protein
MRGGFRSSPRICGYHAVILDDLGSRLFHPTRWPSSRNSFPNVAAVSHARQRRMLSRGQIRPHR